MHLKLIIIFALLSVFFKGKSQDIIYTSKGTTLSVKLVEINQVTIKYKLLENIDGPSYILPKEEVVFIKYENGITEVVNQNPKDYSPKDKIEEDKLKIYNDKVNLHYMNSNLLSINALALLNGDATFIYDKELFKSKMSLSFLAGYNFSSRVSALNLYISNTQVAAKKKYDLGFGINYMPKNTKRIQYYIGFLGKYMSYNYDKEITVINNQITYARSTATQISYLLVNGWIYRISPFFNFKMFVSFGGQSNSVPLKGTDGVGGQEQDFTTAPKMYLGYCFGYRF